jgi:hypothetical protein
MPILLFTEDCLVDERFAVLTFIKLFSMLVICARPSFLEVAPCFQCRGKNPHQRQYQKKLRSSNFDLVDCSSTVRLLGLPRLLP